MKSNEIRELIVEEIQRKGVDLKQELFNLRFQHGTGQLENTARLKQTKRDIARVETILKEKQSSESGKSE
jgi:large subunit ribosomal protein L29